MSQRDDDSEEERHVGVDTTPQSRRFFPLTQRDLQHPWLIEVW